MLIIRPIQLHDLEQFITLACKANFGLFSLTKDPEYLTKRLHDSIRSFEHIDHKPTPGEAFLFVLEDLTTHRIVGISGIIPKVGGFEPFYAFRLRTTKLQCKALNIKKEISTLHPYAEHNGPCEICSLYLDENYRNSGNGRLLSLSRFLYMSEHPTHFDPEVIAILRGVISPNGHSPFYEAATRNFFDIDIIQAALHAVHDKSFIGKLMPKHPLYISLLPEHVQKIIGEVHKNTQPARHLLEQEGFKFSGLVDIFDAGPILSCPRNKVRTIRHSTEATIHAITPAQLSKSQYIISTTNNNFRATIAPASFHSLNQVRISPDTAQKLELDIGNRIRISPLRSSRKPRKNQP